MHRSRASALCLVAIAALALPLAAPAAAGGLDCEAPESWVARTSCRSPAIKRMDTELQALALQALQRSDDAAGFTADAQAWRSDKLDACTTVRCIETSYRARMDAMRERIAAATPPLLVPGDYRRDAGDGPTMSIAFLGEHRYTLRIQSAAEAAPPVQGEFTEYAGAAAFDADGCALTMSFAFDVAMVSSATPACGAAVDGTYRRATPEP